MHNKIIVDGDYIIATAKTASGADPNAEEIERMLQHQPEAPDGQVYRLRADALTWELCAESSDAQNSDITTADALSIITGGVV